MAGEAAQQRRQLHAKTPAVSVGTLLDLVIADYKANGKRSLNDLKGKIAHSLRPCFGEMPAHQVDSDEIDAGSACAKPGASGDQ